jgi:hypothetical protein
MTKPVPPALNTLQFSLYFVTAMALLGPIYMQVTQPGEGLRKNLWEQLLSEPNFIGALLLSSLLLLVSALLCPRRPISAAKLALVAIALPWLFYACTIPFLLPPALIGMVNAYSVMLYWVPCLTLLVTTLFSAHLLFRFKPDSGKR